MYGVMAVQPRYLSSQVLHVDRPGGVNSWEIGLIATTSAVVGVDCRGPVVLVVEATSRKR